MSRLLHATARTFAHAALWLEALALMLDRRRTVQVAYDLEREISRSNGRP